MSPQNPIPFDVLARDLDLSLNYLIEASAGTGKTFAIEHLVVRYLLEEPKIPIDQILVATFTRKAARQVRGRVHQNLMAARRALVHARDSEVGTATDAPPPYLQAVIDSGKTAVARAIAYLQDALENFDQARISTIHTVCYRLLRQDAIGSGIARSLEKSAAQSLEEIERRIHHWLFQVWGNIEREDAEAQALLRALSEQPIGWREKDLVQELTRALFLAEPFDCTPGQSHLIAQLRESIDDFALSELAECFASEPSPLKYINGKQRAQATRAIALLRTAQDNDNPPAASLKDVREMLARCTSANLKNANSKDPKLLKLFSDVETVLTKFKPRLERVESAKDAFMRIAQECREALGAHALEEGLTLEHDHVVHWIAERAQDPHFAANVQKQVRVFIVDEFQDTDPTQWNLFAHLFLRPKGAVRAVFVGDPKQSIYAFRRVNIYTYEGAKAHVDQIRTLNTNFRAKRSLVEGLNTLFSSQTSGNWIELPRSGKHLEVQTLISHHRGEDACKRIHFLPKLETFEQIGIFTADKIAQILAAGNAGTIAILVDTHREAERLQRLLASKGVESFAARSSNSSDLPAKQWLIALLQMVLKQNESTLTRALLQPPIGWSDQQIAKCFDVVDFADRPSAIRQLKKLGELWRLRDRLRQTLYYRGCAAFIDTLMQSRWHGDLATVEQRWYCRCTRAERGEWDEVAQALIDLATERQLQPHQLIKALEDWTRSGGKEGEGNESFSGVEAGTKVQILTLYACKGLEFSHVFALGVVCGRGGLHPKKDAKRFNWITTENESGTLVNIDRDLLKGADRQMFELDYEAEKARLLYVALTRAKDHLYIPLPLPRSTSKGIAPLEWLCARIGQPHGTYDEIVTRISKGNLDPFFSWLMMQTRDQSSPFAQLPPMQVFAQSAPTLAERNPLLSGDEAKALHPTKASFHFRPTFERTSFSAWAARRSVHRDPDEMFGGESTDRPTSMEETSREPAASVQLDLSDAPALLQSVKGSSPDDPWHRLPRGAAVGEALHFLLQHLVMHREWLKSENVAAFDRLVAPLSAELRAFPLREMLDEVFCAPLRGRGDSLTLHQVSATRCRPEMEFLMPQRMASGPPQPYRGTYWNGYIDLLFEQDQMYYLLDWKSNYLGSDATSYTPQTIEDHIKSCAYPAQASLYAEALRRYLAMCNIQGAFGGFIFFFLRPRQAHLIPASKFAEPMAFLSGGTPL